MQNPASVDDSKAGAITHPIVLYSCLYGKREAFNPDTFGANRGVYPCLVFSDNPRLPVPEGVTLVHDPLVGLDPNRASRRAKLMPERYLPPCEWSVYLDNKELMTVDVGRLIDHLRTVEGHSLFVCPHETRDCLYDEGQACIRARRDLVDTIIAQLQHYETLEFPRNAGLSRCAFIVRRHDNDLLRRFGECWFEHVLRYSRRDQISFPFGASKLGDKPYHLDPVFEGTPLFMPLTQDSPEGRQPPERKPKPSESQATPSGTEGKPPTVRAEKQTFWKTRVKPYLS